MRNLTIVALSLVAAPAVAQTQYETSSDTRGLRAVPIEQPAPRFPGGTRTGQEGWVRLNFVVAPDGTVADPIVVDSVGGAPFEEAALEVLGEWRFESPPGGAESNNNVVDMRFEFQQGRDAATSNFMRRYRRIMTHVHNEQTAEARSRLDEAVELGGWNLYESAMLCLMAGRVEDQEGNDLGKLEHYRRALGIDNRGMLKNKDRRDLLTRIFEVEYETGQYSAALNTAAALAAMPGGDAASKAVDDDVRTIRASLAGTEDVVAEARVVNACRCDSGEPVWSYRPYRKSFTFADVGPGVGTFEARCDASRLTANAEAGVVHELPADGENCRVFVFGDAGATFRFVEAGTGNDGRAFGAVGRAE